MIFLGSRATFSVKNKLYRLKAFAKIIKRQRSWLDLIRKSKFFLRKFNPHPYKTHLLLPIIRLIYADDLFWNISLKNRNSLRPARVSNPVYETNTRHYALNPAKFNFYDFYAKKFLFFADLPLKCVLAGLNLVLKS